MASAERPPALLDRSEQCPSLLDVTSVSDGDSLSMVACDRSQCDVDELSEAGDDTADRFYAPPAQWREGGERTLSSLLDNTNTILSDGSDRCSLSADVESLPSELEDVNSMASSSAPQWPPTVFAELGPAVAPDARLLLPDTRASPALSGGGGRAPRPSCAYITGPHSFANSTVDVEARTVDECRPRSVPNILRSGGRRGQPPYARCRSAAPHVAPLRLPIPASAVRGRRVGASPTANIAQAVQSFLVQPTTSYMPVIHDDKANAYSGKGLFITKDPRTGCHATVTTLHNAIRSLRRKGPSPPPADGDHSAPAAAAAAGAAGRTLRVWRSSPSMLLVEMRASFVCTRCNRRFGKFDEGAIHCRACTGGGTTTIRVAGCNGGRRAHAGNKRVIMSPRPAGGRPVRTVVVDRSASSVAAAAEADRRRERVMHKFASTCKVWGMAAADFSHEPKVVAIKGRASHALNSSAPSRTTPAGATAWRPAAALAPRGRLAPDEPPCPPLLAAAAGTSSAIGHGGRRPDARRVITAKR